MSDSLIMTSALRLCRKCGSEIPADAPEGGCPGCLLESGLGLFEDTSVAGFDDPGPPASPMPATTRAAAMLVKFGDFEIARREDGSLWELGRGGMGLTYRARDAVLHRSVALKVIEVPPAAGNSQAVRERFLREARAAAALRHPNVAAVYHFGTVPEPDRCYYAMELVEGETLEARVRREGPLKVAQVLEIGVQVTRALIAAANQGLIHRDLKPGNIMLTRSEDSSAGFEVKVIDFGLAKVTAESFGEMDLTHGGFVGTPSYASPEQFAGSRVDARSDIYSLGASLWFALTGRLPCAGANVEAIRRCQTEAPLPVQQLVARKVPALVIELLRSMLAVDSDERPASARELMEEIENCRSKLTRGDETTHPSFFAELKRRNVYKVAIAYGVVAWLLMQVASQIFPFFEIPSWAVRLVVLALIIGFPVAVILAWAFELTPEGIKREEDVDLGSSITGKTGRKLDFFIIAVLVLVIGLLLFQRLHHTVPSAVSSSPEKSIAVLPFENLSRDPDNAYFAEGIQEEILTRLASIADLKVISRTSTQRYQSKPVNLAEIAKQLGVATILEGSVQKVADQVRVNVQLVNAQTDSHLWAETYDRKLTDIFGVESEIAKGIAESLQAKLTGREEQALAVKPTNNPDAYDAYLRGLAFEARGSLNLELEAAGFYERAVQLDPNFAIAWARLSRADAFLYFGGNELTRREPAKHALENAQKLAPNAPETLLALGYYQYWVLRDYALAKTTFGRVSKMLPSSSDAPMALALIARREGHWDQSIAYFEQALAFDPRNVELLNPAAFTYACFRQFRTALKLWDRVLDIRPNDPDVMANKAGIYQAQGNLPEAAKSLREVNAQTSSEGAFGTKITQLRLERNYGEVVRFLQARLAHDVDSQYNKAVNQAAIALTQRLAGDAAGAKLIAEQARNTLELLYRDPPDNLLRAVRAADMSRAYAAMGEKDAALEAAQRAVTVLPRAKDAVDGPSFEENLALIQTIFGENSRAISTLTQLLETPYKSGVYVQAPITPALLRLDPLWDPLHADPAFQKLCEDKEPLLSAPMQIPEKSIAVLPFQNLSEEKANAYFAEGIQNEILTKLTTVRDLKVISRTSTAKYQSKPDNLKTVAQELGVSSILEGAVQKAGDKVRVNVQLIDAYTDSHLWAKSYDRDFKDVLAVESEVAEQIAEALQANLSPSESHVLASARTHDTEAYDLFLRGEYEFHQAESSFAADALDRADAFYRQALARDPSFAMAAAELAYARLFRHWFLAPLTPRELGDVKSIIDRALVFAPDSPEAHFALGLFFYWGHREYENALAEFNRVRELQPNNALAREYCAYVYRRRGEWERSLAEFQRAQELDPRDAGIPGGIGSTYEALRLWKDAERAELRALAIDPHNTVAALDLLRTRLNGTGNIDSARRALDSFPEAIKSLNLIFGARGATAFAHVQAIIGDWVYLDVMERRFTDAFQAVEKRVVNAGPAHLRQLAGRAALRVLAGHPEAAKSAGEEALPLLEARFKERPDDTLAMAELSWVYLALGRNADALRLSRQAADTISIEKDAHSGPSFQLGLAQIEARAGAPEEAVKRLGRLLSIPAGWVVSIALLKIDPVWDPIRSRPDFQQLLSGPEQIGPNK
jgi:TolB-like protein/Tfp pilus assembly protein PilF